MQVFSSRVAGWGRGLRVLLLMAVAAGGAGCVTEPEGGSFEGIQITFENGMSGGTIGDASDDWQPLSGGCVAFTGAYPNPATATTNLRFSLCRHETVELYIESAPGKSVKTLITKSMLEAGVHVYTLSVADLQPGIYRAWLAIHGSSGVQRTYGDIKVER